MELPGCSLQGPLRSAPPTKPQRPNALGPKLSCSLQEDVLARPLEDRPGSEGARVALGQTRAGRHLRVVYVPDPEPASVFVITAYELGPKELKALRRRRRRKR